MNAEDWGVLKGLQARWSMGVESDALMLIQLLNNQEYKKYPMDPWVNIKDLMEEE